MSLTISQVPREVLALMGALFHDQREHPHRLPKKFSVKDLMHLTRPYDRQKRTPDDYALFGNHIDGFARGQMKPGGICDDCHAVFCSGAPPAEYGEFQYLHVFDGQFTSYFLCDFCAENWWSQGDTALKSLPVPLFRGLYICPDQKRVEVETRQRTSVMNPFPVMFDLICSIQAETNPDIRTIQ